MKWFDDIDPDDRFFLLFMAMMLIPFAIWMCLKVLFPAGLVPGGAP